MNHSPHGRLTPVAETVIRLPRGHYVFVYVQTQISSAGNIGIGQDGGLKVVEAIDGHGEDAGLYVVGVADVGDHAVHGQSVAEVGKQRVCFVAGMKGNSCT